jgi:hypothetical protein
MRFLLRTRSPVRGGEFGTLPVDAFASAPSDSTSRWTSLPLASDLWSAASYYQACSGLSLPSYCPCRVHMKNPGVSSWVLHWRENLLYWPAPYPDPKIGAQLFSSSKISGACANQRFDGVCTRPSNQELGTTKGRRTYSSRCTKEREMIMTRELYSCLAHFKTGLRRVVL